MTLVGKTVGRFRVLSLLGRGGMGEVYVAYDETLDRRVALKSIVASRRLEPSAQARFRREARALSRLDHPNICRIFDYVEMETHDLLVLELVSGRRLDDAIKRGVDLDERLRIAAQVTAALVAAHAEGIVHRDLKPGNVMLSEAGEIKVLDFGLAWTGDARPVPPPAPAPPREAVDAQEPFAGLEASEATEAGFVGGPAVVRDLLPPTLAEGAPHTTPAWAPESRSFEAEVDATRLGTIVGTPAYMSPEQARGEATSTATDMYALGLLLQQLFTGRPPQPEHLDSTELIQRAWRAESLPVEGLSKELTALIAQLKAAAPAARPTAVEVASRLAWIRDAPRRRLRRVAIAAGLALVAAAGIKYTLDLRAERTIARQAEAEAERRRGQAEDLVQFMLGDLRERLESVGRLDALDGAAAKALDYFASVDADALTDADRFRRARALTQIGEVRIAQGDIAAAKPLLQEAHALTSALVLGEPKNGEWRMGLGTIEFWLGNVAWLEGDLARAEEHFRAYLDAADRLVAIDGSKPEWRMEKAYAHSNLGTVQNARGNVDAALEQFRLTVEVERALVAAEPGEPRWQKELANGLSWLGEVLFGRGELEESRARYEEARAAFTHLTELAPEDTGYRFLLGLQRRKLGTTLESLGRREDAIEEYSQSLTIHRQLAELDPANADWKREVALSHLLLGDALALDSPASALSHLRRSVELLEALHRDDPTNRERQLDFAEARRALSSGLLAAGEVGSALSEARAAERALGPAPEDAASDDRAYRQLAGEIQLALGNALAAGGKVGEARAAWTMAESTLAPLARGDRDPRVLAPYARALLALGRRAEAQPIVERLRAGGYRSAAIDTELR